MMSWIEQPKDDFFGTLDLSALRVDQAYLNITTDAPFSLYKLSDDCYRCSFVLEREVNGSQALAVSARRGVTWRLYENRTSKRLHLEDLAGLLCELRPKRFGEFGVYDLRLDGGACSLDTALDPVNIYLPLLLIGVGLAVLAIVLSLVAFLWRKCTKVDDDIELATPKRRVIALDTFRGLSIVMMIFVNYGAGEYWFFDHATWNGLYFADVIFPWFMWIMGVCIPISIGSQIRKNVNRSIILLGVLKRSVILFMLGVALNTVGVGPDLTNIRIMGVLQRFSISYFMVATIVTLLSFNFIFTQCKKPNDSVPMFSDIIHLLPQWLVVLMIFASHCYFSFFFPVPACPIGYLGPGGVQYGTKFRGCTGGATGYIDKLVLGTSHLYSHPTCDSVYLTGPFDPEGLLGCLTSILQVFLGVQAGFTLMYHQYNPKRVMIRWLSWGTVFGLMGIVLCQARQEGGWIPINKNIWSFSFVCVTSCLAFFLLTLLYLIIDVKKYWSGTPFVYPGMNATILYVGHQLTYNLFPWHWTVGSMNTHFVLTIESLWGTALWILIAYWLYYKKFFLTL